MRELVVALVSGAVFGSTFSGTGEDLFSAIHKSEQGKHSRADESAADVYALELVAKRYGHVKGSTFFFERIGKEEPTGAAGRFASYFSTHPMSADRIGALDDHARASGFALDGELLPADPSFKASLKDGAPPGPADPAGSDPRPEGTQTKPDPAPADPAD